MRVTCIVPLRNHEEWIQDSLQSLVSQGYPDLKIVIVNDGSSDSSENKVRGLFQGEVQPKVQHNPKIFKGFIGPCESMLISFIDGHGPSFSRNVGIRSAWDITDVFAFLDSDDSYCLGKIGKSIDVFKKWPEIGVVYSDYTTKRKDGVRVLQSKQPFNRERLLSECLVNMNSLVKKEVFQKVGMFDESLRVCEDYDFWLRSSEHFLFYHIPESLIDWSVGCHSSTSTVSQEVWQACYRRVFEKLQQRISG
jgi:glycosyltransferase involved in cell wall biosynthesis